MGKPSLVHEPTRNEAIALRFQQLTEETTLHGLPQLKRSNSRIKRTLWVLIMVVVGVIMCSHIAILVMSFVEKEINVEIKIKSARELPFPAVTICNSNPIKMSALVEAAKDNPSLLRLLEIDSGQTSARTKRSVVDDNETSTTTTEPDTTNIEQEAPPGAKIDYSVMNNELDEGFQTEEEITRILSSLPEEERVKIGYSNTEMLFQCRYNGRHCNITKHFQHFYNVFHGNCYTFNSAVPDMDQKNSTRTGRRYGLELAVNINQEEYLRAGNELAGVLLLVHSPDMMPFPEDDGIMLLPGIFSIIGLRLNKIQRALPPVGECMRNDIDTMDINVYEELYSSKYSKKACLKTCYQQHLIKSCHCAIPYFPREGKAFGYAEVSLCSIQPESEQKECMDKINKEFADNTLTCDCPSICNEDIYLSSISTAQWPIVSATDEVMDELAYFYPDMFEEPENNTDPDYKSKIMLNNFLKVVVFYEDLNHEMVTEFRAYTEIKFLSDMGGTMGLWMGVSVLTIMEIMEFAATVLYYFFTKKKEPPNPPNVNSKEHYDQWRMTQVNQMFGAELYVPPSSKSDQ